MFKKVMENFGKIISRKYEIKGKNETVIIALGEIITRKKYHHMQCQKGKKEKQKYNVCLIGT